jgi:3-oxoacyl-[acyl-carrier protein] reductase
MRAPELSGKVVLITGGGTGLGAQIARQLAEAGADVAVHYSRSRDEALATVEALRGLGVRAMAVRAELNGAAAVSDTTAMVEQVVATLGKLDIVINNAATTRAVDFADLTHLTAEDWDLVLNVNTKAPFFVAQVAAPHLA